MKVWQIATGEPGRDYRRLFFDYDLMILGPSDRGNALDGRYRDGVANSPGSQVHKFATGPSPATGCSRDWARRSSALAGYRRNQNTNIASMRPFDRCTAGI